MKDLAVPPEGRRLLTRRAALGGGLALSLAGCNSMGVDLPGADLGKPAASLPAAGGPLVGETLGNGPVRVGMILPLTQNGAPSPVGASMRNAAQLAIDEFAAPYITLMIEDDRSGPDGAGAGRSSRNRGRRRDPSRTGVRQRCETGGLGREGAPASRSSPFRPTSASPLPGVYLLSFLIEGYVDTDRSISRFPRAKVLRGRWRRRTTTPISRSGDSSRRPGGSTREWSSSPAMGRASRRARSQQVAAVANQIDALFIPEQAEGMPAVASALSASGVKTQILGTGVWNDARVLRLPALQGAWFAAPDNAGFNAFAQRYKAKFNSQPVRLATLSYDAVTLVAALARGGGAEPFSDRALTNSPASTAPTASSASAATDPTSAALR